MPSLGVENDLVSLFFHHKDPLSQLSHTEQGQFGMRYNCAFPSQLPVSSPVCVFGISCHVLKLHIPEIFGTSEFWTQLVIRFEMAAPFVNKSLTLPWEIPLKFYPLCYNFSSNVLLLLLLTKKYYSNYAKHCRSLNGRCHFLGEGGKIIFFQARTYAPHS